jgi:hypothetical protein
MIGCRSKWMLTLLIVMVLWFISDALNAKARTPTRSQPGTAYILAGNVNADDPPAYKLVSFKAEESEHHNVVTVQWETSAEIDTVGFYLWRSESKDGVYTKITDDLTPAQGGDSWGASYLYDDYDVLSGKTYYYQLEEIGYNQTHRFYGPVASDGSIMIDDEHYHDGDDNDHRAYISCFISTLF